MKTLLTYLIIGTVFVVIETLLPQMPVGKPNLLLLLVLTLGLKEKVSLGGPASWLLGCLQDSLAGSTLGLFGLVYLILYLCLRSVAGHLNSESPALLLFLILAGTLLQGMVLIFTLGFLAEHGTYWRQIVAALPGQLAVNLLAALIFLQLSSWLRSHARHFGRKGGLS
jgi:rod shape-determining protein MreD